MSLASTNDHSPLRRANPALGAMLLLGGVLLLLAGLSLLILITPVLVAVVMISGSLALAVAMGAIAVCAVALIPLAVLVLDHGFRLFDRRFTGRCPRCDYDLRGLSSHACPECGCGAH